ncbi:MAG: hypothetical protein R2838_13280 [Caldilineaceae bacterium]
MPANSWLAAKLPKLTQLTWDNMAAIAPAMATAMGLCRGDVVELSVDGRTVKGPIDAAGSSQQCQSP